MSNLNGDKGPRCRSCDGYGIVECPQHGHTCSPCGGTGVDNPDRHPARPEYHDLLAKRIDPGVRSGREKLTC